jgi:hypothetical protein
MGYNLCKSIDSNNDHNYVIYTLEYIWKIAHVFNETVEGQDSCTCKLLKPFNGIKHVKITGYKTLMKIYVDKLCKYSKKYCQNMKVSDLTEPVQVSTCIEIEIEIFLNIFCI